MHAPNSPRVRALALIVPAAALLVSGCSRDELAPDCFEIDPNTGVCLVPDPGGTAVGIDCTNFPEGAVGATYAFTPPVGGGSGNYTMWMATNLPPGLSIDSNTGLISGVPTQAMEYTGISITVFDAGKGTSFSSECGPLLINPALSSNPVLNEPNHCVPFDASKDEMIALLDGGDGSDITCRAFTDSGSATCPLGDGNGRPAPGITFNDSSCTHSGTIAGNRHGTWVWMIELTQSDYVITVPYCATNDIGTYHDLIMTANGNVTPNTDPGLLEYDDVDSLSFGNGSYHWDINDPLCPGPDCNNFGFRFDVTCAPFDAINPWVITLAPSSGTSTGLLHEMTATGPVVADKFTKRPFVASFEMDYCTSATPSDCDVNTPTFGQTAQTHYHFDVIGFPSL